MAGTRVFTKVAFVVDTGADRTALMPSDIAKLGIDLARYPRRAQSTGVGGRVTAYEVPLMLGFGEAGVGTYLYTIIAQAMPPNPDLAGVPSLLGRDVLGRWAMAWSPRSDLLSFDVVDADHLLAANGSP